MEDIFRRLGNVEVSVADLRTQVGIIVGTMPHLATAAALSDVKSQVSAVAAAMPHLATNAAVSEISAIIPTLATKEALSEIAAVIPHLATAASVSELRSEMSVMHAAIIKWIVATGLTSTGLAFTIAKFVH